MPRKSARKKKQPVTKKKLGFFKFLFRYFFVILVCVIAFSIANKIFSEINKSPKCANTKSCNDLSLKIENNAKGYFAGRTVIPPKIDMESEINTSPVLGAAIKEGDKHIYVDLKKQTIYAYQGSELILKTLTSTGKWGRTPAGNFNIWSKFRAVRMSGGSGSDYYNLPNVPYTMFFYGDYALHGAYWHNNFGHTMSHGCVNLREIDAKALFEWADGPSKGKLGTAVSVCDEITDDNMCIQKNPVR